jgi:predicted outer membrane repeat protein
MRGAIAGRGPVTVTETVIEGNTAAGNGGGIYTLSGPVNITDSTVTGNTATLGGAVFINTFGSVTLNGTSNLCGNTPDDWPGCAP